MKTKWYIAAITLLIFLMVVWEQPKKEAGEYVIFRTTEHISFGAIALAENCGDELTAYGDNIGFSYSSLPCDELITNAYTIDRCGDNIQLILEGQTSIPIWKGDMPGVLCSCTESVEGKGYVHKFIVGDPDASKVETSPLPIDSDREVTCGSSLTNYQYMISRKDEYISGQRDLTSTKDMLNDWVDAGVGVDLG